MGARSSFLRVVFLGKGALGPPDVAAEEAQKTKFKVTRVSAILSPASKALR